MSISKQTTVLPFSTASDDEILSMLKEYKIGLTVDEAKKIVDLLGRDPTLTEAVIWGIQGSEHCSYKSSRRFLKNFITKGKHIILGPVEDSGVVAITDGPPGKRWGFVVTHESHNHPSQIVPYEGAATGIGGSVRDVLCMGARVIGCMDLLRLGDLKTEESKSIANEVIRGIAGYGNPLGIPNLGGDTFFDSSYNSNCLVNAIALGIVREDEIIHSYCPKEAGEVGYDIILVGKPTDRSGFGGASFSSASMEEDKNEQNSGAVQEPNPFLKRHIFASFYALFDWIIVNNKLDKISCKDLGAGGVVCASVEQVVGLGFGADIQIDNVHVGLEGLPAEVIACAETQERLCITCHPELTDHILKHFNEVWDLPSVAENARASLIGKVTTDGIYRATYKGEVICEASAEALTCGLQYTRPTNEKATSYTEPEIMCNEINIEFGLPYPNPLYRFTIQEVFEAMISHPNYASKSPAFRHFDKNVIGNTIIEAGEADASVIAPLQDLESHVHEGTHPGWDLSEKDRWTGVAIAGDGNGRYGRISAYWQGVNATLESMRNVVAVGGTPRALTDCLNYGNPEIPEQLAELEQGVQGIADVAKTIHFEGEPVPVISGNVSLYNGKLDGSSIDPTAIVSTTGVLKDARKAVTMQLKNDDSVIVLIGDRKRELGGSAYYAILEQLTNADTDALLGNSVPKPDLTQANTEMVRVLELIQSGCVRSCHDISDGGMALALFEMTLPQRKIGGKIGLDISLDTLEGASDTLLFSETAGFLLEMSAEDAEKEGLSDAIIGKTTTDSSFKITHNAISLISAKLSDLGISWANGLYSVL
ncbi:phosphoribosylformylglycinamidine synthase subunit PurL [Candidatus Peregrinibacteria bacterium CG10_big_fil_rev_8_21_14_0_10_42_8]|nr:MAG: phosphoribosylformylglycinamidine synthase subunit PurL [Candidatus Peregrinibacteria bacterium CG10_big_fil_rev_8_21_14_0_10_42_8]